MMTVTTDRTSQATTPTVLADRFILTEVDRSTLVFPAEWVAEIWRIDRTEILELPFYDSLLVGIVHHHGSIVPLVAAARLLELTFTLRERLLVVRLNETAGKLANVGIIVDRAIGSSNRDLLPPSIFEPAVDLYAETILLDPATISPDLWQPQRWREL
jgi:chemotaxis signal transduction protein